MISKFKIPLAIIVVALIALVIFLVYAQNRSKKQDKPNYQKLAQLPSPTPTLEDIQKTVVENINAKNFEAVAAYMKEPTTEVTIKSTECCIFSIPKQAAARLAYITEGIPMDFDQNNSKIVDLKSKYKELAGTFIGISKSKGHLIAFYFNKENKIASVTMAVDSKVFGFNEQPTGQP